MFIVRRWWQKHGLQMILSILSLAIALFLFQSKGGIILEIYGNFARSLQPYTQKERQIIQKEALFQELQIKIKELEVENKQLKNFLKYKQTNNENLITGRIIGRSPDAWWQIVTLGVGSNQGVKVDNVVKGIGGLVGRIIEVTPNTSRVLLISDPSSRIGATITRTRYLGFIKGNSNQTAIMVFYAKVADVKIGDTVTTSSISTIFPPNIPIGKVISIDLNKSPAPEAIIQFSAPINFLEWVTVEKN